MQRADSVPCAPPRAESYLDHAGSLNSGALYSILRTNLGEIAVQFSLNDAVTSTVFAYLERHAAPIEDLLKTPLRWHNPPDTVTAFVEMRRSADLDDVIAWPEYYEWLRLRLELLRRVMWRYVGRVPPPRAVREWNAEAFFEHLRAFNPDACAATERLVSWAKERRLRSEWGRGSRAGSLTLRYPLFEQPYRPLSLLTSGVMVWRFADMRRTFPWESRALRAELLERLNETCSWHLPPAVIDKRPALPLRMLDDSVALGGVIETLEWYMTQSEAAWRRS